MARARVAILDGTSSEAASGKSVSMTRKTKPGKDRHSSGATGPGGAGYRGGTPAPIRGCPLNDLACRRSGALSDG
eukprot:23071-Eustigmatos_ZCMA.PRE.1